MNKYNLTSALSNIYIVINLFCDNNKDYQKPSLISVFARKQNQLNIQSENLEHWD